MFINLTTLVCAWVSITSVLGGCSTVHQRKEIRSLSSDELQRYVSAVKKLHSQIDYSTGFSRLELFSKSHTEDSEKIHYHPLFFPWHRYFIREYEKSLQEIDSSVHLPYWDWTLDASNATSSKVLSKDMFGSHGDYKSGSNCVIDGLFAGLNFTYPTKHCLQRRYDQGETISSLPSYEELNPYLNEETFSKFSGQIEYPHGAPHNNIGGQNNDFWDMHSPNDPLFYLHHSFMDLLWNEWSQRHPNSNPYDGDEYGENVSTSQSLLTWNATVQMTLDTKSESFCYTYPRYPSIGGYSTSSTNSQSGQVVARSFIPSNLISITSPSTKALANPLVSGPLSKLPFDKLLKVLKAGYKPIVPFLNAFPQQKKIKKIKPLPDAWLKMNGFNLDKAKKHFKLQNEYLDLLNAIPNFVPYEHLMKQN